MEFAALSKLNRFKEIILVLVRYGFDDLVDRLGLPGADFIKKMQHIEGKNQSTKKEKTSGFAANKERFLLCQNSILIDIKQCIKTIL